MPSRLAHYIGRHHIGLLALFVALGGTSYAAIALPRNSVGAAQIKANAVTSPKVKDRSLLAKDFKAGQLPTGQQGTQGPKGDKGDQGPKGDKGDAGTPGATNVVVRTQSFGATPAGVHVVFIVKCEEGERAVSGGAGFSGNASNEELQQSYPVEADQTAAEAGDTPTAWLSIIKNNTASPLVATGYVVCAKP